MSAFELAQLNVGIIKGPMDSPVLADFAGRSGNMSAFALVTDGTRLWAAFAGRVLTVGKDGKLYCYDTTCEQDALEARAAEHRSAS